MPKSLTKIALDGNPRRRRPDPARRPEIPMSQRVYHALRRTLMAGGFRPGESVSLRSLAKRLGTSAMPVREAVHRLIAEQALQLLPNRLIIVPRMTRPKFVELTELRETLEGMAAGIAVDKVTDLEIDRLVELNALLIEAIPGDDISVTLTRNRDFHFALYEIAGTEILMTMIEGLWTQGGPFLNLSLAEQKWSWTNAQHGAVLRGLRRRSREMVVEAVQRDIRDTAKLLLERGMFDSD